MTTQMTPQTASVVEQPDLEAWAWSAIKDLPGITSFTYAATPLDHLGWQVAWFLQVDTRAKRKAAAQQAAEQARQRILALADLPWPAGVITYVQGIEGPFWLPDLEDGQPRYVARYEIRVHPPRQLAASP